MSSRDNALFTAPRASHFALLISEDDRSEEEIVETFTENAPASDKATLTVEAVANGHFIVPPVKSAQDQSDDWSCATGKTHRKPSISKAPTPGPTRTTNFTNKKGPGTLPLSIEQFSPELTLEIYNFPVAWRTSDIRKLFNQFEGHYRLKWQDDTSCWIHFESPELAAKALAQVHDESASLRVFSPDNLLSTTPKPEALIQLSAETTMEIYGFPAAWRSPEITKLLSAYDGHYRLKWRNDASCFIVFETGKLLEEARQALAKEVAIKVRPYFGEANNSLKR